MCIVLLVDFILDGPKLLCVKVDLCLVEAEIGNAAHLIIYTLHICEV